MPLKRKFGKPAVIVTDYSSIRMGFCQFIPAGYFLRIALSQKYLATGKLNLFFLYLKYIGLSHHLPVKKGDIKWTNYVLLVTIIFGAYRVIELRGIGIIQHSISKEFTMPPQCTENQSNNYSEQRFRLSLRNLTSAFVVLLIGSTSSLIAFIGENLVAFYRFHI